MTTAWQVLRRDFATSLEAEPKSPNTLRLHLGAVDKLSQSAQEQGGSDGPLLVLRRHEQGVEARHLVLDLRALQQFIGWLVREEEIDRSPRERMRPPRDPESPAPVLSDERLRTLLAACDGKDFVDRRDTAIIRLFLDTGCRPAELDPWAPPPRARAHADTRL